MKIQLTINSALEQTEIHIYAKEYNEQIEQLMKQLKAANTVHAGVIDGYLQQEIHLLKITDIFLSMPKIRKFTCKQMSKNMKRSENYTS